MTDYAQLSADTNPQAVKASVNLAGVVMSYGISLSPDADGRLVGLCPFHDDHDESFAVWQWPDDGVWACGCWSCDFHTGDLFDFLQRMHAFGFRQAMEKALELRDSDLPEAPEVVESTAPRADIGQALARTNASDRTAIVSLLMERGVETPAEWLQREFRVAVDGYDVLVPHFNAAGELVNMKRRSPETGWTPIASKGYKLEELYGVWRLKGRRELILCEGESDTWTVAYLLRDQPVDVLGLPSGVAARPRADWVDLCRGKAVTILFDADRAGRVGAGTWCASIAEPADQVRVACLPDGLDATSASSATTLQAIEEAWPFVDPSALPLTEQGGRYIRTKDDGTVTVLSDFSLKPERLVIMEDGGVVFEVHAPGKQALQQLTGAELSSTPRMARWCADRLLSWKGGSRDLSELLQLLKAQSLLIARVRGTDVAGLHEDAFVLPNEVIGPAGWGYVPPENDIGIDQSLRLEEGEWDPALPAMLTQLHIPEVITPILGWVAAAPLRSLVAKFPVLGVTGGSGWGKTTLLAAVLDAFGFWTTTPTTLTGATAHGIHSYVGSTNSFPIWVDEYRPGARIEAKLALDQIIRDAWDGSATIKGGMSENRMRIKKLPARAPIVVTGEDSFSETSHAERMVMIPVPRDGRDSTALVQVQEAQKIGMGRTYLQWLLASLHAETIPAPPNVPDRQLQARAVAYWGYQLLCQFTQEVCGYELPPYDGALAKRAHKAVEETPIILEALIESLDRQDRDLKPIAFVEGDDILVKPVSLCRWVESSTDFQMPGKSKAVTTWLVQQYGATQERHAVWGRMLRVPGVAPK